MRVLLLPSWYFPAGTDVLSGRMVHHLASGLRDEGMDASVFFADYSPKGPLIKKVSFQTEDGVPTWRISGFFPPKKTEYLMRWWIQRFVKDLLRYIRKQGKPDIIHAHSYFAAAVCAALQKHITIPFIYTERLSTFVLESIPKHHYPFLPGCFERATAITCVSPGLLDRMQRHTAMRIHVIPNFFDETIFYPEPEVKKSGPFSWITVGEPAHVKGLDLLLRSFALLKSEMQGVGMKLILADQIPEQKELQALADTLAISGDIEWAGLLTQKKLAERFRQSHAFVSASRAETFGKVIIEAQACGLPVVATLTDGGKYIVNTPEQGETAVPGSVESLTAAMGKVFIRYQDFNPQQISSRITKRFGRKVVVQQWMHLYKSIVP